MKKGIATVRGVEALAGFICALILLPRIGNAAILFQDDDFDTVLSDNIVVGSNDAGAANTSIQFGADAIAAENGTISWDITTNTFNLDHTTSITGDLSNSGTFTSTGLITGNAGANISGGILNFNVSSNFATNINTGTSTGQVSLGGNANCVQVDSNTWDVSCPGIISGLTGITSTGAINFTGGSSFRIPQAAADPGTCTIGQQYFNTTTASVRLCTATNTWTSVAPSGTGYLFAYDLTTQNVAAANTFQTVTYSNNGSLDGWTHTPGSAVFTATKTGTYMGAITGRMRKAGGFNTEGSMRLIRNGTEVPGSQIYTDTNSNRVGTVSGTFIFTATVGDTISVQIAGGSNNVEVTPGGNGVTLPSTQFTVWRMN